MGLLLPCRWPLSYNQWWECDFVTEGIVDNGEISPLLPQAFPLGFLVLGCSSVGCLLQWGADAVPAALWEAVPLCTLGMISAPLLCPHREEVACLDPAAQHLAPDMSVINQPLPPLQAAVFGTACRTYRRSCVPAWMMSPCPCPSSCARPTRFGTPLCACHSSRGAYSRARGLLGC